MSSFNAGERLTIGVAVAAACLSAPVMAEAAPATPAARAADAVQVADSGQPGDIVVTAQRRETRLQETPASITAVGGVALQNAAIVGVNDLTKAVPGLVVTDGGAGQRRVSLRGIRSAGEAQVGVYYDEAPVSGPPGTTSDAGGNQSDFTLFDVARVEVLRGPQGTLYGSSSMGGTMRIIHNKPNSDFGGAIDVTGTSTAHGGESYRLNAMVNVPIIADVLALRGVYYRRDEAGWIDNPGLGLKRINAEETDGGRLLLRFTPAHWLALDAAAYFQNSKGAPSSWSPSVGRYQAANRAQLAFEDKSRLYTASAAVTFAFADLVATTTYQDRETVLVRDPYYLLAMAPNNPTFCKRHFSAATCATPQGMADFNAYVATVTPVSYYAPQESTNWTNEVRLQSHTGDLLNWTVGAYWARRKSQVHSLGVLVDGRGALIESAPLVFDRQVEDKLRQTAGFGEVSLKPIEGLTVTGGLRYYDYRRSVGGDTSKGFDLINFAVQPWTVRETQENGWLYKANVAYQASPTILVYAQAASGFRPGGANQVLGLPDSFTPYTADSLWTYEAGAKTSTLDGALLFNITGYVTDWKNMQVTGTSGTFAFLTNAGSAQVKGIEIEAVARPMAGLQFSGNFNLLSAKLVEDQINDLVIASGRKGDRIPNIPNVSIAVAGDYSWRIGNGGLKGLVHADLNYVGRSYADFRPTAVTYRRVGDYVLASLRIGLSNERWGAFLFANNLFDTVARTSAANVLGGTLETITTAPPRTIGINLTTNF